MSVLFCFPFVWPPPEGAPDFILFVRFRAWVFRDQTPRSQCCAALRILVLFSHRVKGKLTPVRPSVQCVHAQAGHQDHSIAELLSSRCSGSDSSRIQFTHRGAIFEQASLSWAWPRRSKATEKEERRVRRGGGARAAQEHVRHKKVVRKWAVAALDYADRRIIGERQETTEAETENENFEDGDVATLDEFRRSANRSIGGRRRAASTRLCLDRWERLRNALKSTEDRHADDVYDSIAILILTYLPWPNRAFLDSLALIFNRDFRCSNSNFN